MELTLRHNPMLDDADCEAILAIHAAVGWDRRMPPAELRTLYQHSGYSLLATENAPAGKRAWFGMFPQLGPSIGFLAANGLFLALAMLLSEEQFRDWCWRSR